MQPVIPRYRVPLFNALTERGFQVEVHASPSIPGTPANAPNLPAWADTSHVCVETAGGRLLWQHGLQLPKDFAGTLVINGNPRYLSSLWLALKARLRGIQVIWWGHGWSPTSVTWRAGIRHKLMHVASRLLLYTDQEAAIYTGRLPVFGLNNTIDNTPIEAAKAKWSQRRLQRFRQERSLQNRKVLLFCGRLRSKPSPELHVALAALAKLEHNYVLAVIGSGTERIQQQRIEHALGIQDRVLFLGPIYDEAELAPWFLTAECFVFPGAIGLGLLHAFSYGLPVVTHSDKRLHGPEIAALRDNENGLLFNKGCATDLANKIQAIDQGRMSKQALKTMQRFSFDNMVERFVLCVTS